MDSTHATMHNLWRAAGLGSGWAPLSFVWRIGSSVFHSLQMLSLLQKMWNIRAGFTAHTFFLRVCVFWAQMQLLVHTGRANSKHLNSKMPSYLCKYLPSLWLCIKWQGLVTLLQQNTVVFYGWGLTLYLRHVCTWVLCPISLWHQSSVRVQLHWEMHPFKLYF